MEPAESATSLQFVSVKTTLPKVPLLAHELREPIVTDRLIIRPHTEDDLAGLHALRTQPEVMVWTAVGRVDRDIEETKTKLALSLPPNDADKFNFAICLKATGEYIGQGGSHRRLDSLGWPAIGYMFRTEFWGQGLATEFVTAFTEAYWALPRQEYEASVDSKTLVADGPDGGRARELLVAVTVSDNGASHRVLEKCGFKLVRTWVEKDLRDPEVDVTLLGFALQNPHDSVVPGTAK